MRLAFALVLVTALSSIAVAGETSQGAELDEIVVPVRARAEVRAELAKHRNDNLAAFRAYVKAGVYPSNVIDGKPANVWRDKDGHLCAAATIIDKSGAHDLVQRVAEQNNGLKLADVKQGPVMDWILTSGFTQEELVLIQRPFRPVTDEPSPSGGPVDAKLRAAETARLAKLYKQIDNDLTDNADKSLDLATDRLMAHPDVAVKL